jgi:outer membrane protein W
MRTSSAKDRAPVFFMTRPRWTLTVFWLTSSSRAISGTAFRYVNSMPLLLTGNYYLGQSGGTRPFLGVGAGTYWIENRTEAGTFLLEERIWHVGLMGEAGIVIRRPNRTVTLSARYNWGLEKEDIEQTYLTFSIGLNGGG